MFDNHHDIRMGNFFSYDDHFNSMLDLQFKLYNYKENHKFYKELRNASIELLPVTRSSNRRPYPVAVTEHGNYSLLMVFYAVTKSGHVLVHSF